MEYDVYWELPSGVDLETFLKKHPPEFKFKIDYFYYIVDYISKGMDQEDLDNNSGFINVNAQKLQATNHNYKLYLEHLLKHRFLRTDMNYVVGSKSKGFLINSYKGFEATVKRIEISDFVIIKKKIREAKSHIQQFKETCKQYPHLTKWFNEKLQIDVEGATQKVAELFPEDLNAIRGTKKGHPSKWAKRYKAIYSIHKFNKQDFYYGVDENVGRFHSNLTNIKKELRSYITYDGEKLVNIDIKNSQPLMSILLFKEEFYKNKGQLINLYNIQTALLLLNNNKSINKYSSYNSSIIMLVKALKSIDKQEVSYYSDMVNSGEFYQKLSTILFPKAAFDKSRLKTLTFSVFFSKNRFIGQPHAKDKRAFKKHFPEVYNIFRIIKKNNHRALAHILQRIESTLMIEKVVSRIASERPELPIFTIHDSITTTVGNEDYVKMIFIEEAFKLTGLNVRIGI